MDKKFHWLINGVFPCNIGFTRSRKQFYKAVKTYASNPEEYEFGDDAARLTIIAKPKDNYFRTFIITVNWEGESKATMAALIAHEATHLCQYLWEQIGEHEPGHEAEAYLVQSIVQQILEIEWGEK